MLWQMGQWQTAERSRYGREGKSDFANIVQGIKSTLKPRLNLVAKWSGRQQLRSSDPVEMKPGIRDFYLDFIYLYIPTSCSSGNFLTKPLEGKWGGNDTRGGCVRACLNCVDNQNSTTVLIFIWVLFPYCDNKQSYHRLVCSAGLWAAGPALLGAGSTHQGGKGAQLEGAGTGNHAVSQKGRKEERIKQDTSWKN